MDRLHILCTLQQSLDDWMRWWTVFIESSQMWMKLKFPILFTLSIFPLFCLIRSLAFSIFSLSLLLDGYLELLFIIFVHAADIAFFTLPLTLTTSHSALLRSVSFSPLSALLQSIHFLCSRGLDHLNNFTRHFFTPPSSYFNSFLWSFFVLHPSLLLLRTSPFAPSPNFTLPLIHSTSPLASSLGAPYSFFVVFACSFPFIFLAGFICMRNTNTIDPISFVERIKPSKNLGYGNPPFSGCTQYKRNIAELLSLGR